MKNIIFNKFSCSYNFFCDKWILILRCLTKCQIIGRVYNIEREYSKNAASIHLYIGASPILTLSAY